MMNAKNDFLLSVVIPAYNEEKTVGALLEKVLETPYEKEVIVIDDGSTDHTAREVMRVGGGEVKMISHAKNLGKGAALSTGFREARGDIVIIQDADLEYDPKSYSALLEPILNDKADVVYGSRFLGGEHGVLYFSHALANRLLTLWSNIWSNRNFTDMETCYKVFRSEVLSDIELKECGFGIEPEITQKISRRKWRIFEVPITYCGRTYKEGKKIGLKDGLRALWCVVRYAVRD